MSASHRPEVAIAILHRDGKFLMQLRDDVPGIIYPGHWGLFGGHLEPGESADVAVRRELLEEISYAPLELTRVSCYADDRAVRHVYQGLLDVELDRLVLNEGWDMDLLTPEDIRRGSCHSVRANQVRPLARAAQQILLDFIDNRR